MISGPTSRASVIEFEAGHAHVSVAFALGTARCFVGPSVDMMRDDMVPLETLWGRSGGCLRERLLEALTPQDALSVMEDVLLRHMTGVRGAGPAVIAAAAMLSRGVLVGEVASDLGLLPRTLRRRFTAQVVVTGGLLVLSGIRDAACPRSSRFSSASTGCQNGAGMYRSGRSGSA